MRGYRIPYTILYTESECWFLSRYLIPYYILKVNVGFCPDGRLGWSYLFRFVSDSKGSEPFQPCCVVWCADWESG